MSLKPQLAGGHQLAIYKRRQETELGMRTNPVGNQSGTRTRDRRIVSPTLGQLGQELSC